MGTKQARLAASPSARHLHVVLASASQRRRRLLKRALRGLAGATLGFRAAETPEKIRKGEPFAAAAIRLAAEKAAKVSLQEPSAVVIGADTIAYFVRRAFSQKDGRWRLRRWNFRKTEDAGKARRVLEFLSGKWHWVATGVAVLFPGGRRVEYASLARVRMRRLNPKMISDYLKTGEWRGRAGCYDISGKGAALVEKVRGEKETVIGLPLKRLRKLLSAGRVRAFRG